MAGEELTDDDLQGMMILTKRDVGRRRWIATRQTCNMEHNFQCQTCSRTFSAKTAATRHEQHRICGTNTKYESFKVRQILQVFKYQIENTDQFVYYLMVQWQPTYVLLRDMDCADELKRYLESFDPENNHHGFVMCDETSDDELEELVNEAKDFSTIIDDSIGGKRIEKENLDPIWKGQERNWLDLNTMNDE